MFNLHTQNVRGLDTRTTKTESWFNLMKSKHGTGILDVLFLQESHGTDSLSIEYERRYAKTWGYTLGPEQRTLSFWGPSAAASGGTAILVNPHSRLTACAAWMKNLWSVNCCAISGVIGAQKVYFINIYGHRHGQLRLELYDKLKANPPTDEIILGGDFNEIIHSELDCSNSKRAKSSSQDGLLRMLTNWRLTDCLHDNIMVCQTRADTFNFWATQHTIDTNYPRAKTRPAESIIGTSLQLQPPGYHNAPLRRHSAGPIMAA